MSFAAYYQVFAAGRAAGIPHERVRRAFAGHVVVVEDDFWKVEYDADTSCDLFLQPLADREDLLHSVSFHRPCADERLWNGIFALLDERGSVFHFPGGAALTRDVSLSTALPVDLLGALGMPVVVTAPGALRDVVEAAHLASGDPWTSG